MSETNRYGPLASRVYHLDKPIGRSFGDIEYYAERLAECPGPVLEPAVGNGRVLIPLLERGLDVRGFDASEEMLTYCRAACARRGLSASLEQQGFETFSQALAFAAIIIPAGSFQLITDPGRARAVLRRFRAALRPGGRLILDLEPLSALSAPPGAARHWHDGADLLTLTEQRVESDPVCQTTCSQLRYELWRDGALVATEIDLFALRFWGVLEFELALREAGFEEIEIAADYRRGVRPSAQAGIFTFVAR
ncbi:class I SAM-dependent methyltransferase [Marichromatium bheemlicum]|uniref:Class I SAM-dependent methyltransferase n=1 Tax=Marichromatium bheemlicum TaxID=365339 RepID=A0ABX1I783_9GAMM|nr:class I SAM-dependent methyltransferase [Marichromatium bheemlicum]NKN33016.1 class I SAM-dependent methyltransferase [Marichromatium bheemlicum]